MSPQLLFLAALLSSMIPLAWWLLALTSPSYHYQQVMFPANSYAFVDVSLWTIHAQSDCLPFMSNAPIIGNKAKGQGGTKQRLDERACHWILQNIDGRSIPDVATFVCSVQFAALNVLDVGCTTVVNLSVASRILVACISAIIFFQFVALGGSFIFFTFRPTLKVRMIILVGSVASIILGAFGIFLYCYIGGYLTSTSFGMLGAFADVDMYSQFTSYNLGVIIVSTALLCQIFGTVGLTIFVKRNMCVDTEANIAEAEEQLLDDMKEKFRNQRKKRLSKKHSQQIPADWGHQPYDPYQQQQQHYLC